MINTILNLNREEMNAAIQILEESFQEYLSDCALKVIEEHSKYDNYTEEEIDDVASSYVLSEIDSAHRVNGRIPSVFYWARVKHKTTKARDLKIYCGLDSLVSSIEFNLILSSPILRFDTRDYSKFSEPLGEFLYCIRSKVSSEADQKNEILQKILKE